MHPMRHLIKLVEDFQFDVDTSNSKDSWFNLNRDYTGSKKKNEDLQHLRINDDKIKVGDNKIYINDEIVGSFGIKSIGEFKADDGNIYANSVELKGGFIIDEKFRYSGVGKKTICKIFECDTSVKNIFLYTLDDQGSVDFWLKIGGKIVYKWSQQSQIRIQREDVNCVV